MPTCMECGSPLDAERRKGTLFCTRAHKQAYHNRSISRGNQALPLLYRWRALRSSDPQASNQALSLMCAMVSDWIDRDKRAGRAIPSIPELPVALANGDAKVYRPSTGKPAVNQHQPWFNATNKAGKFKHK